MLLQLVGCLEHQMTYGTLSVLPSHHLHYIRHVLNLSGPRLRGWEVLTPHQGSHLLLHSDQSSHLHNHLFRTRSMDLPQLAADLTSAEGTADVPTIGAGAPCLTAQQVMAGSKSRSSASSSLDIPTRASSSVSAGHLHLNIIWHNLKVSNTYFSRSSSACTEMQSNW